jgi:hypothetical protein
MCQHPAATGVGAVTCQLDAIRAALQAAPADDLGGSAAQHRLTGRVAGVRRTVDKVEPGTRRGARLSRQARRQLSSFASTLLKGKRRHKINRDLADRLVSQVGGVTGELKSQFEQPPR